MLYLPLGQSLVVRERLGDCRDCCFYDTLCEFLNPGYLACSKENRKDRKDVVFQMVEEIYPKEDVE